MKNMLPLLSALLLAGCIDPESKENVTTELETPKYLLLSQLPTIHTYNISPAVETMTSYAVHNGADDTSDIKIETFDSFGNAIDVKIGDNHFEYDYSYNSFGLLDTLIQYVDETLFRHTVYTYDENGYLLKDSSLIDNEEFHNYVWDFSGDTVSCSLFESDGVLSKEYFWNTTGEFLYSNIHYSRETTKVEYHSNFRSRVMYRTDGTVHMEYFYNDDEDMLYTVNDGVKDSLTYISYDDRGHWTERTSQSGFTFKRSFTYR